MGGHTDTRTHRRTHANEQTKNANVLLSFCSARLYVARKFLSASTVRTIHLFFRHSRQQRLGRSRVGFLLPFSTCSEHCQRIWRVVGCDDAICRMRMPPAGQVHLSFLRLRLLNLLQRRGTLATTWAPAQHRQQPTIRLQALRMHAWYMTELRSEAARVLHPPSAPAPAPAATVAATVAATPAPAPPPVPPSPSLRAPAPAPAPAPLPTIAASPPCDVTKCYIRKTIDGLPPTKTNPSIAGSCIGPAKFSARAAHLESESASVWQLGASIRAPSHRPPHREIFRAAVPGCAPDSGSCFGCVPCPRHCEFCVQALAVRAEFELIDPSHDSNDIIMS
eukprot:SAG11_NODE_1989_length_3958_cov_3.157554_2_plen_335_part_00